MYQIIEGPTQKIVKRGRASFYWPIAFLAVTASNLIWEVTKRNLPSHIKNSWPWKLTLLDIQTSATLTSAALALFLARAQLSRTTRPIITYTSFGDKKSDFIRSARRIIHVRNAGAGQAVVRSADYRFAPANEQSTPQDHMGEWLSWNDVVGRLDSMGLVWRRDYWLPFLGNGSTLQQSGGKGLEIVAFNRKAILRLAGFEVLLRVEDALGDQYERVLVCLRFAHRKAFERQSRLLLWRW